MAKAGQPWKPDTLLGNRYRIEECVRRSATGCLYSVTDVIEGEAALVMGPGPRISAGDGSHKWFADYCQGILSVSPHRNLLAPLRADAHLGYPFVVFSGTVDTFWDRMIGDGSLSRLPDMLRTALQVAQGLAWLHSLGRLHYNLKPANVLVDEEGVFKLWKYGAAGAKSRCYASPEQLGGEAALTPATDVWSWAVSVLHMFVGKVAWRAGTEAPVVLERYKRKGPARRGLALMPGNLDRVLARCLRADPAERPAETEEVVAEVRAILRALDRPERAVEESVGEKAEPVKKEELSVQQIIEVLEEEQTETPREEAAPQAGRPAAEDEPVRGRKFDPDRRPPSGGRRWRFRHD